MAIDPRTPVIVGVGQFLHRAKGLDDAFDPIRLMVEAIRIAADDAGLAGVPAPDSIRVVSSLSWRYGNPAWLVAESLGVSARELASTTMGGDSPQSVVTATAAGIQAGHLDLALLVGGEAWRTRMRYRKRGERPDWPTAPADATPVKIGAEMEMSLEAETDRGIRQPIQVYPMFETAIRAADGLSPDAHLRRISELWARFSDVAAGNPHAWVRQAMSAEAIRTPSDRNRMVGLPYTKVMNSNNDVDMSAAVIMCSVEAADRLGVGRDRWVFPHSGTGCSEHQFVSHRDSFTRLPAVELGGAMALELAGIGIDDASIIDLYSCFPSAVQLGARSIGLDPYDETRQITRTGGLSFAGGPWNNYVMHSIATVVDELRQAPEERGFVWANGGFATKHAFGVYGAEPPAGGFKLGSPQDQVDALPRRQLAAPVEAAGPATIEAYTVMHGRAGPERAIAACLLGDGRRAWAISDEADVTSALLDGEWVGTRVTLGDDGNLFVG